MRNFTKRVAALFAAITVIAVCPLSAEASTLKTEDGVKYIQYDNGETKPYTGWTKKSGKRYYYKNGIMKKSCWLKSNGKRTYFLRKDGSMAIGKVTISGIEYEFDSTGHLITDEMGISINTSNITSEGMTIEIIFERPVKDSVTSLITADGKYKSVFCEEYYTLEQYTSKGWMAVPFITDEAEWDDLAYELNGCDSYTFNVKWDNIYGTLENGQYRLCKKIYYNNDEGDWVNKVYYGYFTV